MNKILKAFKENGNQFTSNQDDSMPNWDNSCKLLETKSEYVKLGIFGEDPKIHYVGEGFQRYFEKVFTYKIKSGFKDFLEKSVRRSLYRGFDQKLLQLALMEEKENFVKV